MARCRRIVVALRAVPAPPLTGPAAPQRPHRTSAAVQAVAFALEEGGEAAEVVVGFGDGVVVGGVEEALFGELAGLDHDGGLGVEVGGAGALGAVGADADQAFDPDDAELPPGHGQFVTALGVEAVRRGGVLDPGRLVQLELPRRDHPQVHAEAVAGALRGRGRAVVLRLPAAGQFLRGHERGRHQHAARVAVAGAYRVVADVVGHGALLEHHAEQFDLEDALGHAGRGDRVEHEPVDGIDDFVGPAGLGGIGVGGPRRLRADRSGADEPLGAHHPVAGAQHGHLVQRLPVQPVGRPLVRVAGRGVPGVRQFLGRQPELRAHRVAGVLRRAGPEVPLQPPAAGLQFARHAEHRPTAEPQVGIAFPGPPRLLVGERRHRSLRSGHPDGPVRRSVLRVLSHTPHPRTISPRTRANPRNRHPTRPGRGRPVRGAGNCALGPRRAGGRGTAGATTASGPPSGMSWLVARFPAPLRAPGSRGP